MLAYIPYMDPMGNMAVSYSPDMRHHCAKQYNKP